MLEDVSLVLLITHSLFRVFLPVLVLWDQGFQLGPLVPQPSIKMAVHQMHFRSPSLVVAYLSRLASLSSGLVLSLHRDTQHSLWAEESLRCFTSVVLFLNLARPRLLSHKLLLEFFACLSRSWLPRYSIASKVVLPTELVQLPFDSFTWISVDVEAPLQQHTKPADSQVRKGNAAHGITAD